MVTVLGAVTVLACAIALVFRSDLLPWLLAVAVAFPATAAVTVAGQSIVAFPLVAMLVVVVAARGSDLRSMLRADLSAPGLRMLILFCCWAVLLAALAPTVFHGLPVLNPRDGIDDGVKNPASLAPQISNFAQSAYLIIAVAVVAALMSYRSLSPRLPSACFAAGTIASSARALLPDSAATALFDNSVNISYTAGEFEGIERMRGVFSEPSSLGSFAVAGVVYFAMTAALSRGHHRAFAVIMAFWSATNAVLSFSGGALVSGLIILAIVAARGVWLYAAGRSVVSTASLVGVLLASAALVVWGPALMRFIDLMLSDKVASTSYENRSAADTFSYELLGKTLGLGVGLGSNRPSSFLASLLSSTGVIGAVLFGAALSVIVWHALRRPGLQPAGWSLVALAISKVVSGPNIAEPPMWLLIAVCVAVSARTEPAMSPESRAVSDRRAGIATRVAAVRVGTRLS